MFNKKIEKCHCKEDNGEPEPLNCGTKNACEKIVTNKPNRKWKENRFQKFFDRHGSKIEIASFVATVVLVALLSIKINASFWQVGSLIGICFGIYYILFGIIAGFKVFVTIGILSIFGGVLIFRVS